jgi:hypothetical protein
MHIYSTSIVHNIHPISYHFPHSNIDLDIRGLIFLQATFSSMPELQTPPHITLLSALEEVLPILLMHVKYDQSDKKYMNKRVSNVRTQYDLFLSCVIYIVLKFIDLDFLL